MGASMMKMRRGMILFVVMLFLGFVSQACLAVEENYNPVENLDTLVAAGKIKGMVSKGSFQDTNVVGFNVELWVTRHENSSGLPNGCTYDVYWQIKKADGTVLVGKQGDSVNGAAHIGARRPNMFPKWSIDTDKRFYEKYQCGDGFESKAMDFRFERKNGQLTKFQYLWKGFPFKKYADYEFVFGKTRDQIRFNQLHRE